MSDETIEQDFLECLNNFEMKNELLKGQDPHKYYVMYANAVAGICEELKLDISSQYEDSLHKIKHPIEIDINTGADGEYEFHLNNIIGMIEKIKTKFNFRLQKNKTTLKNPIVFKQNYKEQINNCLDKIEKIVNQEISDIDKQGQIHNKLANLRKVVNKDRTTKEIIFDTITETTKVIGECASNLEPLQKLLSNLIRDIFIGSEQPNVLENKEIKQIENNND